MNRRVLFSVQLLGVALALAAFVAWGVDARTRGLLGNTLRLIAGTCAISLPWGAALAWVLVKTNLPGRRAAALVLGGLLLVPLYLQAGAWQAGFGLQGWYTLQYQQPPLLEGLTAAIWIHALAAVPWVTLIVGIGLKSVEPELEEEALLDGSPAQVFLRVTLRRALASLVVAALWVAVITAGEISVTDLFQVRTLAEEIYTSYHLGEASDGLLRWSGALLTLLLSVAAFLLCTRLSPQVTTLTGRSSRVWPLGRGRWLAGLSVLGSLAIIIGVPLANLAYKAGVQVEQLADGRVRSWSGVKLASMIVNSPLHYQREMTWSLSIALCAATAALLVAMPLAWRARRGGSPAAVTLLVAALALAVPGPVLGVSLIGLLNQPDLSLLVWLYDRTIFAPWLAQTIKALPLLTLILWHAFASLPSAILESAACDGAGPLTRFVRIALPQRWPAVITAWLAGLLIALGELAATILVVPPGMTTLPVRIFGLLHYGVEDQVAAICLALVLLVLAVFVITALVARTYSAVTSRNISAK